VNGLRASLGFAALLGVNFSRLGSQFKALLGGSSGEQVKALIDAMVTHWPAVAGACRWMNHGAGPIPDENSIFNSKILEAVRGAMFPPAAPSATNSQGDRYANMF